MLAVTKSLCGYVSNQVQYGECSISTIELLYNNNNYIYIYIYNSWNIVCNPGFHEVFCKTTIIRQLRRWNELEIENTKKYRQKTIGISYAHTHIHSQPHKRNSNGFSSVFFRIFDFQFIPSS